VVGPLTVAAALRAGFDPGFSDPLGGTSGVNWPPPPAFAPLVSNRQRGEIFGVFRFERVAPNKDDIRILDNWEARNVVPLTIPQLAGVTGASRSGRIRVHRLVTERTERCSKPGRSRPDRLVEDLGRRLRAALCARQQYHAVEPRLGHRLRHQCEVESARRRSGTAR
jgi:hypothetical protein